MYENVTKEVMVKTLFGCEVSDISKNVIISPVWPLNSFIEKADSVKKQFKGWYKGVTITYKGIDISVINSCIGAPLTGDCVIALGCTPCEDILFSGSAGGISIKCSFGDLLVSRKAVIGEGFSRYHRDGLTKDCFGEEVFGSDEVAEIIIKNSRVQAEKLGLNTYKGNIYSTDSILGENKESFDFMIKRGCDAVEMELSAVFTASKKIGRKAAGLITISDLPLKSKSLFDGVKEDDILKYNNSVKIIPRILLETAVEL